jgi:hypothetical protein
VPGRITVPNAADPSLTVAQVGSELGEADSGAAAVGGCNLRQRACHPHDCESEGAQAHRIVLLDENGKLLIGKGVAAGCRVGGRLRHRYVPGCGLLLQPFARVSL